MIIHPHGAGAGQLTRVMPATGSFAVGNAPEACRNRLRSTRSGSGAIGQRSRSRFDHCSEYRNSFLAIVARPGCLPPGAPSKGG
jgi:hypothetical protein